MPKYYCNYCNFRTVREYNMKIHLINNHNYKKENYNTYNLPENIDDILNEINIYEFLKKYKNKDITYITNPGNAGDCLIVYGLFTLFDELDIKVKIGDPLKTYHNQILFYAGGGNLVGIYQNCKRFLLNNLKKNNEIVILPHTIKDEDVLIQNLDQNTKIICREKQSFAYVYKNIKNKNNVFLSKDTAFYIKNLEHYNKKTTKEIFNSFRTDGEKTDIILPNDNFDLSTIKNGIYWINNYELIKTANKLFEHISKYNKIFTNRLHIAIAGYLLNKEIHFYPNIYYKNEAVYDYSLKDSDKITFYKKNDDVELLVVFLSCNKNKKLWNNIKNIGISNYIIIVGKKMNKEYELQDNVLYMNCNDLYDGLPEKMIYCINYILLNDKFKKFTHILKIDDHDNKISEKTINTIKKYKNILNQYDYIGQQINIGSNGIKKWHFKKLSKESRWYRKEYTGEFVPWADGGCSYILSKRSMYYINSIFNLKNIEKLRDQEIYEDLMIAKVLKKFNIVPHKISYGVEGDK